MTLALQALHGTAHLGMGTHVTAWARMGAHGHVTQPGTKQLSGLSVAGQKLMFQVIV